MNILTVLVPAAVLACGAVVVMVFLTSNLKKLDEETTAMWHRLQKERIHRIEIAERIAQETKENLPERASNLKEACIEASAAQTALCAADADDAIASALKELRSEAKTSNEGKTVLDLCNEFDASIDAISTAQGVYNNRATMHANAGKAFPTVLVSKHIGFVPQQLYSPKLAGGMQARAAFSGSTALAEKSPIIMNPYMLWAVGLSDTVLEDSPASTNKDN